MTRRYHRHRCACGDVLVCSQPADRCPTEPWQCPACDLDALDAWLQTREVTPSFLNPNLLPVDARKDDSA